MPKEPPQSATETVVIDIPAVVHAELARRASTAGEEGVGALLARLYDPERTEVAGIEELLSLATQPRERVFDIGGKKRRLTIRPLSAEESAAIDRMDAGIIAPKGPNGIPNEEDPDYRRKRADVRRHKQAAAIELAIPILKIPGGSVPEKAKWLVEKLPPGMIDELWSAILQLTSDPVEHALFT